MKVKFSYLNFGDFFEFVGYRSLCQKLDDTHCMRFITNGTKIIVHGFFDIIELSPNDEVFMLNHQESVTSLVNVLARKKV